MGNCSDNFPVTDDYYDQISGDTVLIVFMVIGCTLCVPTLLIYVEELRFLMRTYKKNPVKRMKIMTLLGLYPVISAMSLFSVIVPTSTFICDLILVCYLSVCVYIFITTVVDYFGGECQLVTALADDKFRLNTPPCCCCLVCLKPRTMTSKSLGYLKLFTLQVAFVKPLLLFIQAVLWTDGKYKQGELDPDTAGLYIQIATVISTITSVYCLNVIYRATSNKLTNHRIAIKFFSLKLVILLVNLQTAIFGIMAQYDVPPCVGHMGSKVRGSIVRHSVLIVEALLLALWARKGYRQPEDETYTLHANADTEGPVDTFSNLHETSKSLKELENNHNSVDSTIPINSENAQDAAQILVENGERV